MAHIAIVEALDGKLSECGVDFRECEEWTSDRISAPSCTGQIFSTLVNTLKREYAWLPSQGLCRGPSGLRIDEPSHGSNITIHVILERWTGPSSDTHVWLRHGPSIRLRRSLA
jgi:hypothetical protein